MIKKKGCSLCRNDKEYLSYWSLSIYGYQDVQLCTGCTLSLLEQIGDDIFPMKPIEFTLQWNKEKRRYN